MKRKCVRGKRMFAAALAGVMMFAEIGIWEPVGVKAEERTVSEVREMPKNPVHHCTKDDEEESGNTDTTDWSYVYFGSYPQTEVTGNELTAAITGASYDANGDAWVNGTKYRRISKSDTNNTNYFGDSQYRYFKWEQIKWRVLRVDGSTMFVAADKGLDCKNYHDPGFAVTWETCTLRSWLNNDFYETAFSSREQEAVVSQMVVNEDNPDYNTAGGSDTTDKVYLLSLSEVMNPDYGFCEDYTTYSVSRRVKASDYANARGAYVNTSTDYAGNCFWWLRSPGSDPNVAATVTHVGYVDRRGHNVTVTYANPACVPALHINLSSDLWSIADKDSVNGGNGSGESGGSSVQNPGNKNPGQTIYHADAPEKVKLKKVRSKGRGKLQIKWNLEPSDGYQLQYALNKKFTKGEKTKTLNGRKTGITLKKLKSRKKYFVRIRAYRENNHGGRAYGAWSSVKNCKVK